MPSMSSDQIQNVSVKVVEGFLNDKIPMSTGLAKQASELGMNLEQIKRACEASNVISHLKLMELSNDRTVEFPVCDVNEVMTHMCTPDLQKSAGVTKVAPVQEEANLEKTASEAEHKLELSPAETMYYFVKAAADNERRLSEIEGEVFVVHDKLMKAASELRKEANWNDKLSCIETENYNELSILIGGQAADKRDFGGAELFKEAELAKVKEISELFKMAKCMVAEKAKRAELAKKSKDFQKEAMVATVAGAVGRGLGSAVRTVAKPVVSAVAAPIKGSYEIGRNAIAKTTPGKWLNMQVKPDSSAAKAMRFGAPVAAAAGLDAVAYKSQGGAGAGNDVWDTLQG